MIGKPLLVIAGAGSGKTKVIAARVAQVLLAGVDPNRILLLTFSRRAAREMVNRVERQVALASGQGSQDLPWAGTFHSIAVQMLRRYGSQIGVRPSFTILDRSDAEDLMGIVRHELGLGDSRSRFPKKDTCLAIHSLRVNSQSSLKRVLRKSFPSVRQWLTELKRLFTAYEAAKLAQHVLDYDDLLRLSIVLKVALPTGHAIEAREQGPQSRQAFEIKHEATRQTQLVRALEWLVNADVGHVAADSLLVEAAKQGGKRILGYLFTCSHLHLS